LTRNDEYSGCVCRGRKQNNEKKVSLHGRVTSGKELLNSHNDERKKEGERNSKAMRTWGRGRGGEKKGKNTRREKDGGLLREKKKRANSTIVERTTEENMLTTV